MNVLMNLKIAAKLKKLIKQSLVVVAFPAVAETAAALKPHTLSHHESTKWQAKLLLLLLLLNLWILWAFLSSTAAVLFRSVRAC